MGRKMRSKDRMMKAMDMEEPDRVPVMCQMSIGHMLFQTRYDPVEFWSSAELFAEGLMALRKLYEFDGILISLHGHSPDWKKNIIEMRSEDVGIMVSWKNGDKALFPPDDLPMYYPKKRSSSPLISEFDPRSIPEELDYIPVSLGLNFHIDPEHKYDIFKIIQNKIGDLFSIHGEVTSPFDYFLHHFGHSQGLMALIENPSKVKSILQQYTTGIQKIALEQAAHKVDAVKISSPFAGSGYISPDFYREFILPYEGQIARALRAAGMHVYTHTCGSIGDRLEIMMEAGISGLECLDPPPLGDVKLKEAKEKVGKKVFIKGNIDPINVLLLGSQELIKKDTAELLSIGKPGGGFILSTACSIAPRTPKENIQILAQITEKEGYY
jgi:uroporphyrinogen-III decarboxylase